MSDWKSVLKADPTKWLMEPNNPSVRYFALTELLEKPETEPEDDTEDSYDNDDWDSEDE